MKETYDVCVVGGGAAGMAAAIAAAEGGKSVCIVEKNKKLGKKLYATGNGRCNVANSDMTAIHYHSADPDVSSFLHTCLGTEPNRELFAFLHSIGIYEHCLDGYYYPRSMQASSVVWAFSDRIRALSIVTYCSEYVTDIRRRSDGYHIICGTELVADQVILSCGGLSYPSLGGCDGGIKLAEKLGMKCIPQRPALCAVITEEDTEVIKGVRVACSAQIAHGTVTDQQTGELQITEYGLSGIMIFNLSSEIGRRLEQGKSVTINIDFLQEIQEKDFLQRNESIQRNIYGYLNSYLPEKLAKYILDACELSPKQMLAELSDARMQEIYHRCKKFPFHVRGVKDYEHAQVTAGGISLQEINPETMECQAYPGLYVTGEMLDIDGDCGGYNLTFAILTGLRAGRACYDKN